MDSRFHALCRRARIAAMVLGKGEQFRMFYLHEKDSDAEVRRAGLDGFRSIGVLGLVGGRVEAEAEPGEDNARLLLQARGDFVMAMVQAATATDASRN